MQPLSPLEIHQNSKGFLIYLEDGKLWTSQEIKSFQSMICMIVFKIEGRTFYFGTEKKEFLSLQYIISSEKRGKS